MVKSPLCSFASLLALTCLAVPDLLPAQKRDGAKREQSASELLVKIVLDQEGEKKPRIADAKLRLKPQPFDIGPRKLHWMVEKKRADKPEGLAKALRMITMDPTQRVDDPRRPGRKRIRPVRIVGGKGVRYADVITLFDSLTDAGFPEIAFVPDSLVMTPAGPGDRGLLLVAPVFMPRPVLLPELRPPSCLFAVPATEKDILPKVAILQNGRVRIDGKTITKKGASELELPSLRRQLVKSYKRALAAKRKAEGQEAGPDGPVIRAIWIRADRWTPWKDIAAVMVACHHETVRCDKIFLVVNEPVAIPLKPGLSK